MTNPSKEATIRISINYRCVPGKCEPAFFGLADLQNPTHKWHGFRIFAHNPEVSGSLAYSQCKRASQEAQYLANFVIKAAIIVMDTLNK